MTGTIILLPYAGRGPVTVPDMDAARPVDCGSSDNHYAWWVNQYWTLDVDLFIIEHDVTVPQATIDNMTAYSQPQHAPYLLLPSKTGLDAPVWSVAGHTADGHIYFTTPADGMTAEHVGLGCTYIPAVHRSRARPLPLPLPHWSGVCEWVNAHVRAHSMSERPWWVRWELAVEHEGLSLALDRPH